MQTVCAVAEYLLVVAPASVQFTHRRQASCGLNLFQFTFPVLVSW